MSSSNTTMTYGQLPSREAFDAAYQAQCPNGAGFSFENDERIGTATLYNGALWDALVRAHTEFEDDHTVTCEQSDAAGDWCSQVLSCLGFEWV